LSEQLLKEHPKININGAIFDLSKLKRFESEMPSYRELRNFYWRGPLLFCEAMFGEEMDVDELRRIISTFTFSMNSAESFWIESAQVCADSFDLTTEATQVADYDDRRWEVAAVYSLSYFWSYFLAFGLALKVTKTTSDFIALRRRNANMGP
jgi:hypothetical protein